MSKKGISGFSLNFVKKTQCPSEGKIYDGSIASNVPQTYTNS